MVIFYTLFIFPIVQIIELCFTVFFRLFKNVGFSILGVSLVVSVCTLPFYIFAENIQKKERDFFKRLKPKIDKIKSVFKGDEQYMILSAYYRQNHYHPIYALRNSLNLLIQIPFFIAAYSFLHHSQLLNNCSFFFINDLSKPDALFNIGNININLLPLFMTFINVASGAVYSKNLEFKDKFQLYGIALIFLLLLYNSPSGLVLYWTTNNLFSLFKNILQKTKYKKIIIFGLLFFFIILSDIFLLFFHPGDLPKRLLIIILLSSILLLPIIKKIIKPVRILNLINSKNLFNLPVHVYVFSCLILFILNGYIIPSSLIASSITDFSFIDSYTTPFPFILMTLLQSAGFFLFWTLFIYFLFPQKIRSILLIIMIFTAAISLINVFTITENFGFLTTSMFFSDPKPFSLIPKLYIFNIALIFLIFILLLFLILKNKIKLIASGQVIIIITLFILSIINTVQINNNYIIVREKFKTGENSEYFTNEYSFSRNGKNVLVIMIDAAVGSHVPLIFNEKPDLINVFTGFHYFPNTVSFASHTLIGALPVFGGYEYSPLSINNQKDKTLLEKQQEAYLMLPKLFSEAGFSVTITDPPFDNFRMSNLSIFLNYPEYDAKNLNGKYTAQWLRNNSNIETIKISEILKMNLIRFSFFKSSPLFLRLIIYDQGNWLTLNHSNSNFTNIFIDDYAFLDTIKNITDFKDTGDTYTAIYSHLAHNGTFLQAPDYLPINNVTNKGTSLFAENSTFHLTTASLLLLGKWFEYLKENGVYDNTRIIIVSDHGRGSLNIHNNFRLPDDQLMYGYNALFMFKDFYSNEPPVMQTDFMTNADLPLFALKDIINNPVNPFTGNKIIPEKEEGIMITTLGAVSTYRHGKYIYNIANNQWLFIKDNIFIPENWRRITK